MAWRRIGPGQYKDDKTGKILSGQKIDPNKNPAYNKPAATKPAAPAVTSPTATGPAANTQLSQALSGVAAAGTSPYTRTITPESMAAERTRIEQEQYGTLTRDFARREEQQRQQLEQDLYNRGYRPDQTTTTGPGGWNAMTSQFRQDWQDAYSDAATKAWQMGGQEFDRRAGLQEDIIGSQQQREQYLGGLAEAGLGRASQERMAAEQRRNAIRIAQMQTRRSGVGGMGRGAPADEGFDIL